jgi:threonylcarbamoyladenosine tRNA methylthiotransferase MtaB
MNFSRMHIFPYSRRTGTPAADYPNQVPEEEKKQRVHRMQELADKKVHEFQAGFLNKEVTVLFEPEHNGMVEGLTSNYIRVYATGTSALHGKLCTVYLEKTYRDGVWGVVKK